MNHLVCVLSNMVKYVIAQPSLYTCTSCAKNAILSIIRFSWRGVNHSNVTKIPNIVTVQPSASPLQNLPIPNPLR